MIFAPSVALRLVHCGDTGIAELSGDTPPPLFSPAAPQDSQGFIEEYRFTDEDSSESSSDGN
jgi:hypothetical protein